MRRNHRKRSKTRIRPVVVLSLIFLLSVSAVSIILFSQLNQTNNQVNDSNTHSQDDLPNPTSSDQTTPTSQNSQSIILNKQIPPDYTMGLPVDGGLINGMNVLFIHSSNEKVSIRFTAKLSGAVTKLIINAFAYEGQPTVRVGLQEDKGGNPNGQWMSQNAFGEIQLGSSGFKIMQLGTSAVLTKGKVYHIVIEMVQGSSTGTAGITTYQANGFSQPFNPDDPDIVWNDQKMSMLVFNGNSWQGQNLWPMFIVQHSNGESEGQPYSLIAQWVVWGSTVVGQSIVPASDYKVGKVAFVVSLKAESASDNLYYQIRDANNDVLSEGLFAKSTQLTASQTWIEVTLSIPVILKAGQHYRIVLSSPQSTLDNAYHVYGHEFCYDATIGYGSLQHQLTSSLDGGATWGDNSDADAVFKIITT